MHRHNKQVTIGIVVLSHMLISCLNLPTGVDQQAMQPAQSCQKDTVTANSPVCTTADEQLIACIDTTKTWYATINKPITSKHMPLDFEPNHNLPKVNKQSQVAALPKHQQTTFTFSQPTKAIQELLPDTFIAHKGHQLKFYQQQGQWMARVQANLPKGFSSKLHLPVYGEPALCNIKTLTKHNTTWHQYHMHVCFPTKRQPEQQGYVYLGSMGLKGGAPAKATLGIDNILIKREGPFVCLRHLNDSVIVKEIQFMAQKGLWWANVVYGVFNHATSQWDVAIANKVAVEADQAEILYAEDLATKQIIVDYTLEKANSNQPDPVFNHVKINGISCPQQPVASNQTTNVQQMEEADQEHEEKEEEAEEAAAIEEAAYEELCSKLKHPINGPKLVAENQQQLQELLDSMEAKGKLLMIEAEAKALRDYLAELIKLLKSRHKATNDLYFGPGTSDYLNQRLIQGFQELQSLEQTLQSTEETLSLLCDAFEFEMPSLIMSPLINKQALLEPLSNRKVLLAFINEILETRFPGGKLVQIVLSLVEPPPTWEEYLPIAIEAALDFLPRGKAIRFYNLISGKSTIQVLKTLIIQQARNKVRKINKANKKKKTAKIKEAEKARP